MIQQLVAWIRRFWEDAKPPKCDCASRRCRGCSVHTGFCGCEGCHAAYCRLMGLM